MLNLFGLLNLGIDDFPAVGMESPDVFGSCQVICRSTVSVEATVRTIEQPQQQRRFDDRVTMGVTYAFQPPEVRKRKKAKMAFHYFGNVYEQEVQEPEDIVGLIINDVDLIAGPATVCISLAEISHRPCDIRLVGEIKKLAPKYLLTQENNGEL